MWFSYYDFNKELDFETISCHNISRGSVTTVNIQSKPKKGEHADTERNCSY